MAGAVPELGRDRPAAGLLAGALPAAAWAEDTPTADSLAAAAHTRVDTMAAGIATAGAGAIPLSIRHIIIRIITSLIMAPTVMGTHPTGTMRLRWLWYRRVLP